MRPPWDWIPSHMESPRMWTRFWRYSRFLGFYFLRVAFRLETGVWHPGLRLHFYLHVYSYDFFPQLSLMDPQPHRRDDQASRSIRRPAGPRNTDEPLPPSSQPSRRSHHHHLQKTVSSMATTLMAGMLQPRSERRTHGMAQKGRDHSMSF
jgi:hypothetical protein